MNAQTAPKDILLVEDNDSDVLLTKMAFDAANLSPVFHVAEDGEKALEFLEQVGKGEARPDLILLDLNMPRLNGKQVLEAIKTDPALKRIPVVILSSSSAPRDVDECYDGHANAYVTKPSDFDDFVNVAEAIKRFWFETVTAPAPG